jgi:hypothetical protein
MNIKWNDATQYKQGERGNKEPDAWSVEFEDLRIWIGKTHTLYPGKWVVNCREVGFYAYKTGMNGDVDYKIAGRCAANLVENELKKKLNKVSKVIRKLE